MASTNKTAHYEFPQYIGSDIPNILTDINPAFETIDTALYEQGQQIAEQTTDLSDIQEAVDQATADVAVMQSSIVAMGGVLEITRQLATDNKETIGQGSLETTAQTLIGGVNELLNTFKTLASVTGDGTKTYAEAFKELFDAIPATHKKSTKLKLILTQSSTDFVYYPCYILDNYLSFSFTATYANACDIRTITLSSIQNDNTYYSGRFSGTGNSFTPTDMTTALPSGAIVKIVI